MCGAGAWASGASVRIEGIAWPAAARERASERRRSATSAMRCSVSAMAGLFGEFAEIRAGSMPVATTDTRMMPSRLSSKVAPRMMLASWSTSSRMRVAASSSS
ncbi:hypothetical protein MTDSW087_02632 [Methylobacterium dankookense]|uniref:Uncharacterized protein n=1 Tax=Methylobacterium dankookense TaxID=560405 RepID=A0A564FY73_9HYPH|nr:hypothetical protein MTDSW087_02632 [Methylobacterium dankookense]